MSRIEDKNNSNIVYVPCPSEECNTLAGIFGSRESEILREVHLGLFHADWQRHGSKRAVEIKIDNVCNPRKV